VSEVFPESPPSPPPCGCPEQGGITYHQQGTCTDPVVARLGWYASAPPPATATPGQAAPTADELLRQAADALWACAKAALTVEPMLKEPYADDPRWSPWTRWVERPAREAHDLKVKINRHLKAAPAAAPELAAAMAETRAVRDGYQQLCGEFGPSAQSGWSARISLTVLNRHRGRAGLAELPRTAASGDREDITMRYRRERDEARAELADVRERAEEMELQRDEARWQRDKLRERPGGDHG
jgi:hypothetical protein